MTSTGGTIMRYMLMIHEDEAVYEGEAGQAAWNDIITRHMAFGQWLGSRLVDGAGLQPSRSATVVRTTAGAQTVHDSPFAEAREQLGGYYKVEVADLDEAIEIAKRIPLARDGAIEIRPVLGME
jgi:hypothetical protein